MNKKGFTLVELLAVIVILGVVMLIGSVSLTGIKRNMEKKMFEDKLAAVINGARTYGSDNKSDLQTEISISIKDLINEKYVETDETCENDKCITHYYDKTSINLLKVKVFDKYSRVYACIPLDDYNKNILFKEDGITKDDFSNQDLFCE